MLHQILFSVLLLHATFRSTCASQFLQLTDFHFDKDYSSQFGSITNKCHNATKPTLKPKKGLGQFGEYACDAPKSLIKNALIAVHGVLPNPDFIFWTGDNIPHIDGYDEAYVINSIQTVTSMINDAFPNVKVLPLFGNHDYAPANAFPDHKCELYKRIFGLWKKWIGAANQNTFLKGGYYKYVLGDKVVVLALNTNLYYRFNRAIPNFTNPDDPADQFQFMIDTLKDARAKQLSVHVIAHIAPGVFERTPNFTWMVPKYNQRFIDITIEYADTIKWMIFGHHHTDTFHIVKDPKTDRVVQVYLMSPAITPWFSSLKGAGSNNPAFRIYDYDKATQRLIDAKTYYVNLTKLNRSPHNQTKWELEYSMAKTYQIDGITPENMYSVLKKLKTGGDAFESYIEFNSVRWNVSIPEGEFLKAQLCSIEFPDFTGYDQCMGSSGPSSKSPGSLSTSTKSGPSSKSPGSLSTSTKSGPSSKSPGSLSTSTKSGPSSKSPGSLSTSTKSGPSSKSPGSVSASTKSVYLLIALCSLIKFGFDKNM